MNAKEAIVAEMGDLFLDNPAVVAQDATMNKDEEGLLVLEDDTTFDTATAWDESDEESVEDDHETGEDTSAPSIFDTFKEDEESVDNADTTGNMTDEEIDACIDAADDAMNDTKMPPEIFDWGLDYIRKMYEEKDARLRAKIAAIDWNAARERWATEAEDEEEQERAEREKFLHR